MAKKSAAPARLRVTQVRSGNGKPQKHRDTLRALGFRKHQMTIEHDDTPAIRGMLFQVRHLVAVEPVSEGEA